MFVSQLLKKVGGVVFVRTPLGEMLSGLHSLFLHLNYSFNDRYPGKDREKLRYYLAKHCHIVEKGLALPEPRLGFGQPKIVDLIGKARGYELLYGTDDVTLMLRDMLRAYLDFHQQREYLLPADYESLLRDFCEESKSNLRGGLKKIYKSKWNSYSLENYRDFVSLRHSVRDFSNVSISDARMREIIEVGIKTPSVCNRQGWMVHYYKNKEQIKNILSYQNGNAGFSDSIDKLLVITGNNKAFTRNEHHQIFVDGGLLSMNVMLALHSAGLGSCPLNTCMPFHKAEALKKVAGISKYEKLIMIIAVGNLKEEFLVAQSQKYHIDKILIRH